MTGGNFAAAPCARLDGRSDLVAINARSVATPHQAHERVRAEAYGTERRPFPYDFRKYRQGILRAAEFLSSARLRMRQWACSHEPRTARAAQFAAVTIISIENGEHHADLADTHHPAPR